MINYKKSSIKTSIRYLIHKNRVYCKMKYNKIKYKNNFSFPVYYLEDKIICLYWYKLVYY